MFNVSFQRQVAVAPGLGFPQSVAIVYVVDTAAGAVTDQSNQGGNGPQLVKMVRPSGIVLTTTLTPQTQLSLC